MCQNATYMNCTVGETLERMPMKDIFDMMAGTSTGSILASALSIPEKSGSRYPKYWANQAVAIYENGAHIIF